jgi:hypothetical protein
MSSALLRARILAVSLTLLSANSLVIPAFAANKKEKAAPSGTLLIPLEPKMDDSANAHPALAPVVPAPARKAPAAAPVSAPSAADSASSSQSAPARPHRVRQKAHATAIEAQPLQLDKTAPAPMPDAPKPVNQPTSLGDPSMAPIEGTMDGGISQDPAGGDAIDPLVDENSLLKGTVQIVADDTEYDQEKNTFLGTGNAVAVIAGQNSKLEADTILYDQNNQTIDARGNVKIVRDGQLTTGSSFKFEVSSDEYLITDPDTELQGTQVVARTAIGDRDNLMFRNGSFTLPTPVHIANAGMNGPQSFQERVYELKAHPDAYLPSQQSFKFTAKKMVYEKYKESGNLTVFGGKMKFKHFTVPIPKFNATISQDTKVVFPVTPLVSNNLNVGGVNIGPQFNYGVGKRGVFSWAPLVQIGGRSVYDASTSQNGGKLGAGFRLSYQNDRLSSHIAYGSVSNLLVADLKYQINQKTYFQSGINRFLNDGLMGNRRARMMAEVVNNKYITTIPGIAMVNFRHSGGWAQDQPQLVNLQGSQYSDLFNTGNSTTTKSAFRLQQQIMVISHPLFSVGDEKYGAKMNLYGGTALRAYSTGNGMAMGQFGPILTVKADRARLQVGYTQSGVSGKSPFVFDQFIQGSRSVNLAGDIKLSRWLTVGGNLGYNLTNSMTYQRGISAAIGPEDFKVMLSRDTISGINRFGFDLLYGSPVNFNKMVVKGRGDAAQFGGI